MSDLLVANRPPATKPRNPPATLIEIRAEYRHTLLDVQHLGQARPTGVRPSDCYTIGEAHSSSFVVTPNGLPTSGSFALVRGRSLNFTPEMRGEVRSEGATRTLRQLKEQGMVKSTGSTYAYTLAPGDRCKLEHDEVTFHVEAVTSGDGLPRSLQSSRRFWSYTARTSALVASIIIPAYFATPASGSFAVDSRVEESRFVGYAHQADEPRFRHAVWGGVAGPGNGAATGRGSGLEHGDGHDGSGGQESGHRRRGSDGSDGLGGDGSTPVVGGAGSSGRLHAPGEGSAGEPGPAGLEDDRNEPGNARTASSERACRALDLLAVEAKGYTHSSMLVPNELCEVPQMARNFDPDMMARNVGILGALQQSSGHFLSSPYGGAFAVGNDDEDVWGGLTGTEVGEAFGVGGLGLVGTGRGSGSGYGRGDGLGNYGSRGRPQRVRQGKAKLRGSGKLDKDIIRRIVRAHINEVRHCYNQGLARDERLGGRVTIGFTIGSDGKTSKSIVEKSTLGDELVGNCIAKAVERWKFPKPQGDGPVVVSYPFILEPG